MVLDVEIGESVQNYEGDRLEPLKFGGGPLREILAAAGAIMAYNSTSLAQI